MSLLVLREKGEHTKFLLYRCKQPSHFHLACLSEAAVGDSNAQFITLYEHIVFHFRCVVFCFIMLNDSMPLTNQSLARAIEGPTKCIYPRTHIYQLRVHSCTNFHKLLTIRSIHNQVKKLTCVETHRVCASCVLPDLNENSVESERNERINMNRRKLNDY